jgi:hypothetical protein
MLSRCEENKQVQVFDDNSRRAHTLAECESLVGHGKRHVA